MSDKKIGVVGLGIMGMAMAQNIKKAGFGVTVTTRSDAKRKEAAAAGLAVVSAPREVAQKSDIVIVMVTDPQAVDDVLNGKDGIFSAQGKGKTLIQMSTIDASATTTFAQQAQSNGWKFLDCPVAGSKVQVTQGQLILLAGGDVSVVEENRALLMSMGKAIVHAGDIGQGTALKLCMNLIVAQMTTALCEAYALAQAQNLDPAKIFDVIRNSPALNSGYYQIKEKALLEQNFAPAFSLANMLKDVRFMAQVAEQEKIDLPVLAGVKALMERASASGLGEEDLVSIVKVLRR